MSRKLLPLVVDLDGTLIKTDVTYECFLLFLRHKPLKIGLLLFWWLKGCAFFKKCLAAHTSLDPETLPFHSQFLTYLKEQHEKRREIVLATAADEKIARQIAAYLGLFQAVYASDGKCNLKSYAKARKLVEKYGVNGFVYAGNSRADLPVWAVAAEVIIVNAPTWLIDKQRALRKPMHVFEK